MARNTGYKILTYAILLVFLVIAITPLFLVWSTAFKTKAELIGNVFGLPRQPQLENISAAWEQGHFGIYYKNSVFVVIPVVVLSIALSVFNGYAFTYFHFPLKELLYGIFVFGMTVPLEVVVIQFFFARKDTLTPVVADIVAFVINVALIPPLMALFDLGGIALAAAIAKGLKVLALLILFGRQVPEFRAASLLPFAGKMLVASLATALVLLGCLAFGGSLGADPGLVTQMIYLAVAGLLGGGAFLYSRCF